jgi:acetate kinase
LSGEIERVGTPQAALIAKTAENSAPERRVIEAPDLARAVEPLVAWLDEHVGLQSITAIGHRIVHGGPRYAAAQRVNAELITELKRLSPLDPNHLPGEIALIEAFTRHLASTPQIACFDTAFHHDLPQVARLLAVPRRYEAAGVRRYGFHGLSYSFLMAELARVAGPEAARGRVVLAHLGAGASLAAVRDGRCIDTSMAFTPTAGIVMATRSGDLDPGFLTYVMREEHLDAAAIDDLVNHQSGLLGISETTADMRDLLTREATDVRAAEAVAIFCYQAKKWIGAFAAALGGLDTLVFAGGIGENAAPVRARICSGLEFLGIRFDETRNAAREPLISTDASQVAVRVIRTDEEIVIAQEVERITAT